ncbi:serine hydrolase domain-containing protein [Pontimicrobium aquaticum]|nr:serine hydrolase domain-containing protein [Pontimicrobium aquaticum]
MNTKSLIIIALITASLSINAQTKSIKALDEFVETIYDSIPYAPSISIGVIHNGKIVHKKAYGYSNVENKMPAKTSTQYYIASTTKSFTALAATILGEKGLLDFNKSLADYFPKVKFADSIQADKIKIPDLLGHTSGIDNCAGMTYALSNTGSYTIDQLFDLMENTCARLPYGTYRYSNLGYNIMNLIFLKELGKTWKDVVQEEVLNPIGMNHTYSSYINLLENKEDVATPYQALGVNGKDFFAIPNLFKRDETMHAAGGLYASVDDVLKWLLVQVSDGKINSKTVISPTALAKTRKIRGEVKGKGFGFNGMNISYGLGWNIAKYKDKLLYHHGGAFAGYRTMISYIPETKSGVVVMVNDSNIGNSFTHFLSTFAYDFFDETLKDKDWKQSYYKWITKSKAETKKYGLDPMYQDFLNRSKRTWDLSVPFSAITGAYKCKDENLPIIRVFEKDGELGVSQGIMNARVEPQGFPNAIRIDMTGGGETLQLDVEGDRVKGFTYKDNYYEKL